MQTLFLTQAVGTNAPNASQDVKVIHQKLMDIGKIPCFTCAGDFDDTVLNGIKEVQRHYMAVPDGVISVGGRTHGFLNAWKEKPIKSGVQLMGRLKTAWDWVSPILPDGSNCTSGFRSPADQRRILHDFYLNTCANLIKAKYGQQKYDLVKTNLLANEAQVLEMVRGVGQLIAAPGKSMHQQGKAIDVGGASSIDQKQVETIKLVAKAHSDLFNGKVLLERNGCVHFEIK